MHAASREPQFTQPRLITRRFPYLDVPLLRSLAAKSFGTFKPSVRSPSAGRAKRPASGGIPTDTALAATRLRYGYQRLHVLLQKKGWRVNLKRLYRLYSEEGLSIRTRIPRRRRACRYHLGRAEAGGMKDVWSEPLKSPPVRATMASERHVLQAVR